MAYNEIILWPSQLDVDFPNLFDNETSTVSQDEIFYSAHYNKVKNFIVEAYSLAALSQAATGDGSFHKLSFPVVFEVGLDQVIEISAFQAFFNPMLNLLSGNTIPFEFFITYSSDNYSAEVNNGGASFFNQQANLAGVKSLFGGLDPFGGNIVASAQLVVQSNDLFTQSQMFLPKFSCKCTARIYGNMILIRGVIIANTIPSGLANQGWQFSQSNVVGDAPNLKVCLMALN